MKPVLSQEDQTYFVDNAEIIQFIRDNSKMSWNEASRYVSKVGIVSDNSEPKFWEKSEAQNPTTERTKWIHDFFEAHPWMNKIAIVFTD